jgi:hypothetical protein
MSRVVERAVRRVELHRRPQDAAADGAGRHLQPELEVARPGEREARRARAGEALGAVGGDLQRRRGDRLDLERVLPGRLRLAPRPPQQARGHPEIRQPHALPLVNEAKKQTGPQRITLEVRASIEARGSSRAGYRRATKSRGHLAARGVGVAPGC